MLLPSTHLLNRQYFPTPEKNPRNVASKRAIRKIHVIPALPAATRLPAAARSAARLKL